MKELKIYNALINFFKDTGDKKDNGTNQVYIRMRLGRIRKTNGKRTFKIVY